MIALKYVLFAACAFLSPLSAQAAPQAAPADWPHWRGPERDGISREQDWSPSGIELWRAEVGLGYSTVAIRGDRLYTLGHDAEKSEERVLCLNSESGALIWEHRYSEPTAALFHGGGANSTPTIAGDLVFIAGRNGRCMALVAETGALRWERDYQSELSLARAEFGYSAAPVVLGENAYLALGAKLLCVEAKSGELRWQAKLGETEGYATPHPFYVDEKLALAAFSGEAFVVVDAETGSELYRYPWKGEAGSVNAGTPIIVDSEVFVSSAYGVGAARLSMGESSEPTLVWFTKAMRNKVGGCTLYQDYLYGFDEAMLKCISFEDGSERWRVRGLGMGSVAVAGDRLLVLSAEGELIVAEATPAEFRELSRTQVLEDGVYWTAPVLCGGRIYCRNSLGSLICRDHRLDSKATAAVPENIQPAEVATLPEASVLVRAFAEAQGGAKLAACRSLHVDGSYESSAAGITRTSVSVDWLVPNQWRMEWQVGTFGSAERGFDGQHGWQVDPFYGTFLFEGERLREAQECSRLHEVLEWTKRPQAFSTKARVRFDNRDCWSVLYRSPGGAERTLYFDVQSGDLAGREAQGEALVIYRDYRDFDGIRLAAYTSALMPDSGTQEILMIEKASWNAVDPSRFALPAPIAKKLRSPEEKAAEEARLTKLYGHLRATYASSKQPEHTFVVADGEIALLVGEQTVGLLEPDEQGRFPLVGMGSVYCTFELDESGRGLRLTFAGFPGQEPLVLERVDKK